MAVPTFPVGSAVVQADLQWPITTKPITAISPSGSTSYPNLAAVALPFNTEAVDRYNMHTGSNTTIIAGLEPGWYRVTGFISWGAMTTNSKMFAYIAKNGTFINYSIRSMVAFGSLPTTVATEAFVQMDVATDYLEIVGVQSSGGSILTLGGGDGGILIAEFLGT